MVPSAYLFLVDSYQTEYRYNQGTPVQFASFTLSTFVNVIMVQINFRSSRAFFNHFIKRDSYLCQTLSYVPYSLAQDAGGCSFLSCLFHGFLYLLNLIQEFLCYLHHCSVFYDVLDKTITLLWYMTNNLIENMEQFINKIGRKF